VQGFGLLVSVLAPCGTLEGTRAAARTRINAEPIPAALGT